MHKVSVVVPVYNGEEYISTMLESLESQTLGDDLQIVIVDDGSNDDSFRVASQYVKEESNRIILVHTENHGAAHARNVGMGLADGEYIGFADCDDSVDVTMFEKMYVTATRSDADICSCGYLRVDSFDIQKRDYLLKRCFGFDFYHAPSLLRSNVPYSVTKIYRRSFLCSCGIQFPEDLRIYEDLVFVYSALLKANCVVRVPECLYLYNFSRPGSLTFSFSEKRFDLIPAFKKLVSFYKEQGSFSHAEDELLRIFLLHLYVALDGRPPSVLEKGKTPYDFFCLCAEYLDVEFPWWREYSEFFKASHRNRLLFTNKLFMRVWLSRPRFFYDLARRKDIARKIMRPARPGYIYNWFSRHNLIDSSLVLLDSQRGENLSGNMFYLIKGLLTDDKYSSLSVFVTYFRNSNKEDFIRLLDSHGLMSDRIRLVKYNSRDYNKALATAAYIFTDTSMPVHFVKRPGQLYFNTWHGTPLKALGKDMNNEFASISNITKNFAAADLLFFQNQFMADCMTNSYMIDNGKSKTRLFGYPRNEIFFDLASRHCVLDRLDLKGCQLIAYMPTWRGVGRGDGLAVSPASILRDWDEKLSDDQVVFAKLHHYDASSIDFSSLKHIRPFPSDLETYEMLNACDVLVTDYSSVMFDYACTKRKIVLYAYDRDSYLADRGLYLPLESLPVSHVDRLDDLMAELSVPVDDSLAKLMAERYCNKDRSDCSAKILEASVGSLNHGGVSSSVDLLLFFGNYLYPSSRPEVVLDSCNLDCMNVAVAYESELIMNEILLKEIDPRVSWKGVSYPYSSTSPYDRYLVSLAASHPACLSRHAKRLKRVTAREHQRAFPGLQIACSVVCGREKIMNMLFAANESERSIYFANDIEYALGLPKWILAQFNEVQYISGSCAGHDWISSLPNARAVSSFSL